MSDIRSREAWDKNHQPFELKWWKDAIAGGHSTNDAEFERHWAPVRSFVRPWGKVIDIGCGPRPPFRPCVVIEPLGDEYRKFTPAKWWEDVFLISAPAEEKAPTLAGDTVICWNAIDHAHDWRGILDNMATYARAAGPISKLAISTDFHPEPFIGHPGFGRDEFMVEIDKRFIVTDTRSGPSGAFREWSALLKVKA